MSSIASGDLANVVGTTRLTEGPSPHADAAALTFEVWKYLDPKACALLEDAACAARLWEACQRSWLDATKKRDIVWKHRIVQVAYHYKGDWLVRVLGSGL